MEEFFNTFCHSGFFISPIFSSIVRNFTIPVSPASPLEDKDAALTSPESAKKLELLLHALRSLISLVPLSCGSLLPILQEHFPHRRLPSILLVVYMRQLLQIAENVSVLRSHIFALIISKIIEIDVSRF
jgi:RNA polymerase I-specific transcription initiation factor RRN3